MVKIYDMYACPVLRPSVHTTLFIRFPKYFFPGYILHFACTAAVLQSGWIWVAGRQAIVGSADHPPGKNHQRVESRNQARSGQRSEVPALPHLTANPPPNVPQKDDVGGSIPTNPT
ncbi:hypothetical protein B0T17DRAFT_10972 [Bombardia bombarda]|uniref:Uncharacterized protein n=1 Tax=Bombardia bombarda TaxID=252184 RepID=A0AA40CDA5_9PEZI|nr:hypothetical protein B0T17DRAFT_10972 [Bombardia bombarda]